MKEFVLTDRFDPSLAKIEYKAELNPEQLEVVLGGDGPCLVLAGAGSGKTRTITYRVAYLLEAGVDPEQILLVTFTNKAAKEMISRVERLLGSYPTGLWAGTFHSIANRILRQYATDIGRTPNFTILDTEDTKSLLKLCVKELKVDTTVRRFPSASNLYSIISYARNASIGIEEAVERKHASFIELVPTISRIAQMYDDRKRQADAMDFDDLLIHLRRLLFNNPVVCERLARQFRYILVDEYQDTNVIQADIVHQLASVNKNLLVVGDDAQSIYSFRAAEIRNILGFPDDHKGSKLFRLTTNYRSTPEILTLANRSIAMNADQFEKNLTGVRESADKPSLIPAENGSQEARYIAEQLLQLREDGTALNEIAVLFRAAFHSQALEFELMKRDIPYEYRGGMKFFERAHVKDIVSHLRLVSNPKDEMAWMRVLGLLAGVGPATAQKIIKQLQHLETIDEVVQAEVKVGAKARVGWEQLVLTLKKMIVGNRLPGDMIRAVATSGYQDYLEAEYPDFRDRLEDIEQFALFADGYKDLTRFLDEVSLTEEYGAAREEKASQDDERMILSTIHQAKGLEWDAVFVMRLNEGQFPNQRALEETRGLEEERRLFYVAVTRARKHLFMTYPLTSGYDSLSINQPSSFVTELPDRVYEQVKLRRTFAYQPPSRTSSWDSGEPTIVLDDLGEETEMKGQNQATASFRTLMTCRINRYGLRKEIA